MDDLAELIYRLVPVETPFGHRWKSDKAKFSRVVGGSMRKRKARLMQFLTVK